MKIYSYSESGMELILVDGRNIDASRYRKRQVIKTLCAYCSSDGLIVLDKSESADFKMESFGNDGKSLDSLGIRSATAFADLLGIKGFYAEYYDVETALGTLRAEICARNGEEKTIRLPDGCAETVLCEGECFTD